MDTPFYKFLDKSNYELISNLILNTQGCYMLSINAQIYKENTYFKPESAFYSSEIVDKFEELPMDLENIIKSSKNIDDLIKKYPNSKILFDIYISYDISIYVKSKDLNIKMIFDLSQKI